jgi:CDP-diacylglycerol--glycerol-3-phosphate 3-phosphatidyltransferase
MTISTTKAEAAPRKSMAPTALTLARMLLGAATAGLVLTAVAYLYSDHILAGFIYALALAVFVLAAATDWLDGYLARKLDAVTPLGAALDHAADKVLITCVLAALAYAALPFNLVIAAIIILGRDMAVAGLREGLSASGRSVPVGAVGKWKAAAEMAGVGAFLAYQASAQLTDQAGLVMGLEWAATMLLWAAAGLALISAFQYALALSKPQV